MRLKGIDAPAKTLHARAQKLRLRSNYQHSLVSLRQACLYCLIGSLIVVGLHPAGGVVVVLAVKEHQVLARLRDYLRYLSKACGWLNNKTIYANGKKALDIGPLIIAVKVGTADEEPVSFLAGNRVDALNYLVRECVSDVSHDNTQ